MINKEVIDFDADSLETVIAVSEFLSQNSDDLITRFVPDAKRFLANADDFQGIFKVAYLGAFNAFIVDLIKEELIAHFPTFTPEQILSICDQQVISMISTEQFFNMERYT